MSLKPYTAIRTNEYDYNLVHPMASYALLKTKHFWFVLLSFFLEYYDYAIYSLGVLHIGGYFFPANNENQQLFNGFMFLLLGALAKPIGVYFLSRLGDIKGRIAPLQLSMIGITTSTLMIGFLPGYADIGILAPALLLFLRFIQSVCLSIESDQAGIYLIEHAPEQKKYFYYSFSWVFCGLGFVGAGLTIYICSFLASEYAWRAPFILGGVIGLLILMTRRMLKETPKYMVEGLPKVSGLVSSVEDLPLFNWERIIKLCLIFGGVGGAYQFFFIFLPPVNFMGYGGEGAASQITTCVFLGIFSLSALVAGFVSDYIKGHVTMSIGATCSLIVVVILALSSSHTSVNYMIGIGILSASLGFFSAPGFVIINEYIPVRFRSRLISVSHSTASFIFSKTTPFICLYLWKKSADPAMPFIYFVLLQLMAVLSVFLLKKNIVPKKNTKNTC